MSNKKAIEEIRQKAEKCDSEDFKDDLEELARSVATMRISKEDRASLIEFFGLQARKTHGRKRTSLMQTLMSYNPGKKEIDK